MYTIQGLNEKSLVELKEIALRLGIENINVPKEELVYSIIDQQAVHPDTIKESICPYKIKYMNNHSTFTSNTLKLEVIRISINR